MSNSTKLRAAIIIVSETASRDPSTDKGIPALQNAFADNGGHQWSAEDTSIVTDNVLDIQRAITVRTDGENPVNLLVTSGGTGFAQKDVTPEVRALSHFSSPSRNLPALDLEELEQLELTASRNSLTMLLH